MDRHQLKVMIKKEYKELVKDRGLLASLLIVPIIFSIVLPVLLLLLGTSSEVSSSIAGLNTFIDQFKIIDYPNYITTQRCHSMLSLPTFFCRYLCYSRL